MASRFVSGGTLENPTERDSEWLQAQQDLEAQRRQREDERDKRQDGKTLYEVLQANKAAKEEAFQESIKLKHQFRALDDDEIDFLDAALESTRAKEEAIRKETSEQLERFRQKQDEADKATENSVDTLAGKEDARNGSIESTGDNVDWSINAKKRKRPKEKEGLKGVKTRRTSSTNEKLEAEPKTKVVQDNAIHTSFQAEQPSTTISKPQTSDLSGQTQAPSARSDIANASALGRKDNLGLVGYGSDEDSD